LVAVFILGAIPAFRCNLFIFKEKIKRIFTLIGAMYAGIGFVFLKDKTKGNDNKKSIREHIDLRAFSEINNITKSKLQYNPKALDEI
jgi:hypothetical protein